MNKRRICTYIVPACIALALVAIIGWGYRYLSLQEEQVDTDLYILVPANSEAILETNDINTLNKTIQNSHYANKYQLLHVSKLLEKLTHNIDLLSRQQAHGLSTEMNSQLLVSFHAPGTIHDQVIYGRFGNGDINSITRLIQKSISHTHAPKKLVYQGEEIIIYPIGNEFLACYVQPGFFAISLQEKLIEKVIDTYKNGQSIIQSNPSLNALRKQTKHNEQLSLYLSPEENDKGWKRHDIRMNASAIYLTSHQTITDTCGSKISSPLLERIDEAYLPPYTQMVTQLPFHQFATKDNTTPQATLNTVLNENGCEELTLMLFSHPTSSDTLCQQLLMATIPASNIDQLKASLRLPIKAKRRPSLWLQDTPYPMWQCETDSILNIHFIHTETEHNGHWLSLYQNRLLIANTRETLHNYLANVQNRETPTSYICNRTIFQHCLEDLAEESTFTMVADLSNLIYQYPHVAENIPWIPSFFLKHKEFFKHFMLSTQFIRTDEYTSSQMILTYQGDSLLFKQARD